MYLLYPDTKSIDVIRCFLCHNGYRSLRYVDAPLYETNVPGSREPVIWMHVEVLEPFSHISKHLFHAFLVRNRTWRTSLALLQLTDLADLGAHRTHRPQLSEYSSFTIRLVAERSGRLHRFPGFAGIQIAAFARDGGLSGRSAYDHTAHDPEAYKEGVPLSMMPFPLSWKHGR